jgi:flagellar motility protein MotE (MotC chaperone)
VLELALAVLISAEPPKVEPGDAGSATAPAPATVLPPAVTQTGLCAELNRNGLSIASQRKKLEEERKDLAAQRTELEKLSAEIAKSRAELRLETERLEGLLAQSPGGPAPAHAPLTGAVAQNQLETLAKAVKGMKPEAAAALMQRTDPKLAAQLLQRMKPADAGAVMNHLKPDQAADLLAQMATLPAPRKP